MIQNAKYADSKNWSVIKFSDFFRYEEGEATAERNRDIAFLCFEELLKGKSEKGIRGLKPKDWLFEDGTRSRLEGRCVQGIKTELLRELTFETRRKNLNESFDPKLLESYGTRENPNFPVSLARKLLEFGLPSEVDYMAYNSRAEVLAERLFNACGPVARVAVLAKFCKISTDDPRVNDAAGAKRTKISNEFIAFSQKARTLIAAEGFQRDEQNEAQLLTKLTFDALLRKLLNWAKSSEKMEWAASFIEML